MTTYSVAEARDKLPKLIAKAEAGEAVTITKRGRPVVELHRNSRPPLSATQRAELYEKIRKVREAGPKLDISSVELLREVYEGRRY